MIQCPNLVDVLPIDAIAMIERSELVGSRATCNPPPMDTDEDILILVNDIEDFEDWALENFVAEGYCGEDKSFSSLRLGSLNLIVTDQKSFFDKFMVATTVTKRLNLMNKEDRRALFQAVLYRKAVA